MKEHELTEEVKKHLKFNRFIVSFNHEGGMSVSMVPTNAFIVTPDSFQDMIKEFYGDDKKFLPGIIREAVSRI